MTGRNTAQMGRLRRSVTSLVTLGLAAGALIAIAAPASAATPPADPVALGLQYDSAINCGATVYSSSDTPTLLANESDVDGTGLTLNFDVYAAGSATPVYTSPDLSTSNGARAVWTTPSLPDGRYTYSVRGRTNPNDGTDPVAALHPSAPYAFTVDTVVPTPAPAVSSIDFAGGYVWGAPAGTGTVTVHDNGAPGAYAFSFGWDIGSPMGVNGCTPFSSPKALVGFLRDVSGSAVISTAALSSGPHTLTVRALTAAGNASEITSFVILVSPSYPGEGKTHFEAESVKASVKLVKKPRQTALFGAGSLTYNLTGKAWSNGSERTFFPTAADKTYGPTFSLPFTANVTGLFTVGAQLVTRNDFGVYRVSVTTPAGKVIPFTDPNTGLPLTVDGYSASPGVTYAYLGGVTIAKKGTYTLNFTAIGKDPSSVDGLTLAVVNHKLVFLHNHGCGLGVDFFNAIPLNSP